MCFDGRNSKIGASDIRGIIDARRRRRVLGENLFSDPAWDILLELYASELEHQRHSVGSLTASVHIPATTVLRWIAELERALLVSRSDDPRDCRRIFVSLSSEGSKRIISFFESEGEAI
jgi:DNA-binding MarR family transcriptional regulator